MRMRKFLMLITSVWVKIQLILIRTFIGQLLKGNSMGPIKIHNGGNFAHAQDSIMLITFEPIKISQFTFEIWSVSKGM